MHLKTLFLGMVHRLYETAEGSMVHTIIQMPVVGDQEGRAVIWKTGNFGVGHQLIQVSFKIE